MIKGYWTTRSGEVYKIKDMTTEHLRNCLCMLVGKIELISDETNIIGVYSFADFSRFVKKSLEIRKELEKRERKIYGNSHLRQNRKEIETEE